MKVTWVSFLDPFVFSGGGERNIRTLIETGRRRGHEVVVESFLRDRAQRALRRSRLHRRFEVDMDADAFVLANIRNVPNFPARLPERVVRQVLATGRAAVMQEAWVDVCPFDVPCDGDVSRCRSGCDRAWADELYGAAHAACFNSPMQRDVTASVIGVPLPERQILSRPMIDPDAFRPLGIERDIDVLYVGTISEAKGYRNLLERFGASRLTLAGPNALGEPVQGTWLGPVAYEDLPRLYNRARTFAHLPRWLEPMGRAPVEAALCGCELVLNDRVGVASYPSEDWRDPEVVRRNADRFWEEFERAFA
jgi:glycosyltransferase involved in cell wall biosynthesis